MNSIFTFLWLLIFVLLSLSSIFYLIASLRLQIYVRDNHPKLLGIITHEGNIFTTPLRMSKRLKELKISSEIGEIDSRDLDGRIRACFISYHVSNYSFLAIIPLTIIIWAI